MIMKVNKLEVKKFRCSILEGKTSPAGPSLDLCLSLIRSLPAFSNMVFPSELLEHILYEIWQVHLVRGHIIVTHIHPQRCIQNLVKHLR